MGTGFTDPRLRPSRQNPTSKMAVRPGHDPGVGSFLHAGLTAQCDTNSAQRTMKFFFFSGNQQYVCGILSNLLDERYSCLYLIGFPCGTVYPHLRKTMQLSRALHSPVCIYFKSSSNFQRAMWFLLIVFHKNNLSGLAFSFSGAALRFCYTYWDLVTFRMFAVPHRHYLHDRTGGTRCYYCKTRSAASTCLTVSRTCFAFERTF